MTEIPEIHGGDAEIMMAASRARRNWKAGRETKVAYGGEAVPDWEAMYQSAVRDHKAQAESIHELRAALKEARALLHYMAEFKAEHVGTFKFDYELMQFQAKSWLNTYGEE